MKFSWKWLSELVDLHNIEPKQVMEGLTSAGFEVESKCSENYKHVEDIILDISITANRYDVSSMIGMARELSVILNTKLINQSNSDYIKYIESSKHAKNSGIIVDENILCSLKIATIKLLENGTSPLWLTNCLLTRDIKPTNILRDICAYINLKWGQDIEIFDIGKINNKRVNRSSIQIKTNNYRLEDIYTLLGTKRKNGLKDLATLFYGEALLSILGIVSNMDFYCSHDSNELLVSGQLCEPQYIQKKMLSIGQRTEKSNLHLKSSSLDDLQSAYNEAIYLILTLNKGNLIVDYKYNTKIHKKPAIYIKNNTINRILGPRNNKNNILTSEEICNILKQLRLTCIHENNTFRIEVPEHRKQDLTRNIDIIEEIVRIYGFDKFIDKLPKKNTSGYVSEVSNIIRKIRHILRAFGLHETINCSFETKDRSNQNSVQIYNPLLEDQKQLKESLVREIIYTRTYNQKQKNLSLECFEIGKVFYNNNNGSYTEQIHIAGVIGNPSFSKKIWSEKDTELTWFQAKGLIEEFFEKMRVKIDWVSSINYKNSRIYRSCYSLCHPYRTAILCNSQNKQEIGVFSQLSSAISAETYKDCNIYIFEINLLKLMNCITTNKHLDYHFKPYSVYPSVTRDISLKLSKSDNVSLIQKKILQIMYPLAKSVKIFNEYKRDNEIEGKRYVGFRITYRSHARTLDDEDIKTINHKINFLLKKQL